MSDENQQTGDKTPFENYQEYISYISSEENESPKDRPARPWDLFNKNVGRVTAELAEERIAFCEECPRYRKGVNLCRECGCFMPAKVKLPNASCPIGKWQAVDVK